MSYEFKLVEVAHEDFDNEDESVGCSKYNILLQRCLKFNGMNWKMCRAESAKLGECISAIKRQLSDE